MGKTKMYIRGVGRHHTQDSYWDEGEYMNGGGFMVAGFSPDELAIMVAYTWRDGKFHLEGALADCTVRELVGDAIIEDFDTAEDIFALANAYDSGMGDLLDDYFHDIPIYDGRTLDRYASDSEVTENNHSSAHEIIVWFLSEIWKQYEQNKCEWQFVD